MYKQANANLLALNKKLALQLITNAEGHSENLQRVLKSFNSAQVAKVVDVTLNNETYTFTKAHFEHILQWYTMGGMVVFKSGDAFTNCDDGNDGQHKYTFGEIVERTYYDKSGTKKNEEVILFQESKFIADVVGATELRRVTGTQNDGFTMPCFVWHRDIKRLSPRRFLLDESPMAALIDKVIGFNFEDDVEE